ncbi:MAG: NAD(+)/NADH kinase [Solirubrobacterales bacterium]
MSVEETRAPAAVRTVALVTHSHPPSASEGVAAAIAAAGGVDCRLVATAAEAAKHEGVGEGIEVAEALPEAPDLCLVLGGDGSILWAMRQYAETEVPVFGINFGTIGFLAAAERDQLADGLRRAFAGEFEILRLPGLEVSAAGSSGVGLNDVTFSRRPHGRVAELSYRIADEEVGNVRCDGLVAATPTGSTGYNLANNGPILAWGVEGYVVSYIAPHTLAARPLVVAPDDVLLVGNATGREPVEIAIDGEQLDDLEPGAEAEVRFRDHIGRLAQIPGSSFYRRISEKFGHLAQ